MTELNHDDELKRQKRFATIDDLDPDFRETAQSLGQEELKTKISELAAADQAGKNALKNDDKITALKEELKNLLEPYKDDAKAYKLKTEFLVWVAETKGFPFAK